MTNRENWLAFQKESVAHKWTAEEQSKRLEDEEWLGAYDWICEHPEVAEKLGLSGFEDVPVRKDMGRSDINKHHRQTQQKPRLEFFAKLKRSIKNQSRQFYIDEDRQTVYFDYKGERLQIIIKSVYGKTWARDVVEHLTQGAGK